MVDRYEVSKCDPSRDTLFGRLPEPGDYDAVVSGDADVFDKDTGKHLVCMRRLEPTKAAFLLDACRRLKFGNLQRLGAQKMASRSVVFGYSPRVPLRRNYCSTCALSRENPEANERLCKWALISDKFVKENAPDFYAWHRGIAEQVKPDWRIHDTIFTSGYVNNTCALTYHIDASEFAGTWNVVTVIKRGARGGLTVLPEYRVALDFKGPTMYAFSAPDLVHGVTEIEQVDEDGYRFSVIFYTMEQMAKCGTREEELERIREWSTNAEKRYISGGAPEEDA